MGKHNVQTTISNAIVDNNEGLITPTVMTGVLETFLNETPNVIILKITKPGSGVVVPEVEVMYNDFPNILVDSLTVESYGTSVIRIQSPYPIFPYAKRFVTIESISNLFSRSTQFVMYEDEATYNDKIDIQTIQFNDSIGQWEDMNDSIVYKVKIEILP